MTHDADVIIIGSGPSGVAAAFPLAEAGMRVVVLDGGRERPGLPPRGAYHDLRRTDPEQWRYFLGPGLEAFRSTGAPSPKFDAPGSRFAFEGFSQPNRIDGEGLTVVGSLARGGLTNIWGGGLATYDDDDLTGFPLTASELAPMYRRIAARMGVTGFVDDDVGTAIDREIPSLPLVDLSVNAGKLLSRYESRRIVVQRAGLRLGRPRIALLTEDRGRRRACRLCDMCLWGCRRGSVWSARDDLEELERFANLETRPGWLARRLHREPGCWRVEVRAKGGADTAALRARKVVLAASALATTRLVLRLEERFDQEVPLVGTPAVGFALILLERLGAAVSTREFSMGQLSFTAESDPEMGGDKAYGNLFPASGLPGALIVDRMPLSRPGAVHLFQRLQPALLLGNCFLPGRFTANRVRLANTADGAGRLVASGGTAPGLSDRFDKLRRQIRRGFGKLGARLVPRSFSPLAAGEDLRYCGTFPMKRRPGPGQVDRNGELYGSPGLHLVDLSIFPTMPAKHHTFTMMAIAERIGHVLAERWRDGD